MRLLHSFSTTISSRYTGARESWRVHKRGTPSHSAGYLRPSTALDFGNRTSTSVQSKAPGPDDPVDATIVDADANAITFVRTPAQVLNIVYGGNCGWRSLLPNGLNGTVK
jgi:hypothetical protein